MKWWQVYIGVWTVSAGLSVVLTAVCRRVAPRLGFLDRPLKEAHKRHAEAIPVLGGPAMLIAWLATIGGGLFVSATFQRVLSRQLAYYLPGIQTVMPQLLCIALGATALVALGLADDRWPMHAAAKFAGQFCVAGAVACWGVRVTVFWHHPLITWAITTFWILLLINAINFFDNMDGLAAGTTAIASFLFGVVAMIRGQHFVAVLALTTCGTASGFWWFNSPPATIFMGDAGSHFLGYSLAVIGALTTFYTPAETPTTAPVLIPLLVLGLPIFDAIAVVVMRIGRGQPVYVGDHTHISHRFTKLGLSRGQSVLVVHFLGFAVGAGAVSLLWLPPVGVLMVLLQAALILAVVSMVQAYGTTEEPETPEPAGGKSSATRDDEGSPAL